MAIVIDINRADDQRDVVHRTVQALAEGKLVALPTETVYGLAASALNEQAVQQLLDVKGRQAGHALTLAVKSFDDALDYVPQMSALGQRLARRCWPGPLTLVLNADHPDSLTKQLPSSVRQAVAPKGTVGLRVPAHDLVLSVLRLSAGPLALTSANPSGQPDAIDAQTVVDGLGDHVELIIDEGRCKFGQPSSVVQIQGNRMKILRPGVLNESSLRRLSSFLVVFVCTGNTCRSPMAELMMKKRFADKLGIAVDGLEDRGVLLTSAGIAAMAGGRATPEAIDIMSQRGLDLTLHESQPLTERLVKSADLILTMTHGHREALLAQWPDAVSRTFLLCSDFRDVADPIGGSTKTYEQCAEQIDAQLAVWLDTLDLDSVLTQVEAGD